MNSINGDDAKDLIWGGFIPCGLCTLCGVRLLFRGLRGDVLDGSGMPVASKSWFIAGGLLLQLPLIGYVIFVWKQGLFGA